MHTLPKFCSDLSGNPGDTQTVGPIWSKSDLQQGILKSQCLKHGGSQRSYSRRKHHDAGTLICQAQFLLRTEHAAGFLTTDFRALDLEITRQYRSNLRQSDRIALLKVLCTADDVQYLTAVVDPAE